MTELIRAAPSFRDALRRGGLVGDGGTGTELHERGIALTDCFEAQNQSRPELVRGIHDDFLRAGADVIATNTFGANAIRLARHGREGDVRALNQAGVRLARSACVASAFASESASAPRVAYVAGCIGPTGFAFDREIGADRARVRPAFRAQAEALAAEGVDLLLIETMRHSQELLLALDAVHDVLGTAIPLIAQMSVGATAEMADGRSVVAMATELLDHGVDAIGINCATGPHDVAAAIETLLGLGVALTASPNAGLPRRVGQRFVYSETPDSFGSFARRMFELGVCLVGGCCGATPEHVGKIAAAAAAARHLG